ncbi:MAG: DUF2442 domain-containing protein [Acidobacteria bacterium]|nr:DUF2442 domain-containing protein [Acidobacteriota bacterium]MCA1650161.1 DUF2442 domain-containing protein [Acidobacteriota bacterium]
MPIISVFFGIVVRMFYKEHDPPAADMAFLPLVVRAEHRGGFRIHLVFNDAMEATVDFERWLQGVVFEPLKEPRYFSRFFVEGGTVGLAERC